MIYHPRGTELNRGLFEENSLEAEKYEDGTYEIRSNGQNETVIVRSVAYTGWKMIGVVPESVQVANYKNFRYYVFATILVLLVMLLEGNQLVSRKISKPIRELDASVKTYEAGGKPDIYIGGSSEIRHLGHSVQKSYEQIEELMDEIIQQQNERRKSELDALQSQINPHFLYNTLNTMSGIANAQNCPLVSGICHSLSAIFRYSLNMTDELSTMQNEMDHVRNYLYVMDVRNGSTVAYEYQIDNETLNDRLPRICLQPVVENALTHGLRNTRRKDKKLLIRAEHIGENLVITIADNGTGMDAEAMNVLLERNDRKRVETGVSIGILNVNARLKQLFGAEYGLWIQSQAGKGTTVTITVPIVYSEENDGETGGAHYAKNEI